MCSSSRKDQGRSQSSTIITAAYGMADFGHKICGTRVVYAGDDDGMVYTDKRVRYLYLTRNKVRNAFRRVEWITGLISPQVRTAYIGPVVFGCEVFASSSRLWSYLRRVRRLNSVQPETVEPFRPGRRQSRISANSRFLSRRTLLALSRSDSSFAPLFGSYTHEVFYI